MKNKIIEVRTIKDYLKATKKAKKGDVILCKRSPKLITHPERKKK